MDGTAWAPRHFLFNFAMTLKGKDSFREKAEPSRGWVSSLGHDAKQGRWRG